MNPWRETAKNIQIDEREWVNKSNPLRNKYVDHSEEREFKRVKKKVPEFYLVPSSLALH